MTASEKRLSLGSSIRPALCRSRPVMVPDELSRAGRARSMVGSGPEATAGEVLRAEGGAGVAGTALGGSVPAPTRGFSISIEPPHLAHLVRARARPPSLASSNLYRAWQLGQTTIMTCSPFGIES